MHKQVFFIESDTSWIKLLKSNLPANNKVQFVTVDIETKSETWGHPGPTCSSEKKQMYSRSILQFKDKKIDTFLINGRFRVACALHLHEIISDTTNVLFDDFYNLLNQYECIL